MPCYCYDAVHISKQGAEFDRAIRKFQATKVRVGSVAPQGLIPLCRIWRRNGEIDEEITEVCMSLAPDTDLTWGKLKPSDPSPEESEAVRDDNTSSSDRQSSSEIPPDFVSVKCV